MSDAADVKTWRIEAKTEGREVYYLHADTEEEARQRFDDGAIPEPSVSEVLYAELVSIEETD